MCKGNTKFALCQNISQFLFVDGQLVNITMVVVVYLNINCCFFSFYFVVSLLIRIFATSNLSQIVMEPTVLNASQLHLLQMFAFNKSQEGYEELKNILYEFYSKKMELLLEEAWQKGDISQQRLDEINEMDLHLWLREQKAKQ